MQFAYEEGRVDAIDISTKTVGDEERDLAELRVFCPRSVQIGGEWEDKGGFWINVSLWGERARRLELIEKGAWVSFIGKYSQDSWTDKKTGEERKAMKFVADQVSILPRNIKHIQFTERE